MTANNSSVLRLLVFIGLGAAWIHGVPAEPTRPMIS